MKIRYRLSIIFALLFAVMLFFSCSKNKTSHNNNLVIAALIKNNNEKFLQLYMDALKEKAKASNVQLEIFICNDDADIQMDQVKTLLTFGIKNFVIVPVDTSLTPQITRLIKSRGGSAAFSNIFPSTPALEVGPNFFYASSPETSAGDFQAQILDDYFKKNPSKLHHGKTLNIFYLDGEYGHPAQTYRREGVLSGLEKRGYKVNIIAEESANWLPTSARQIVNNWIKDFNTDFDCVIAQNDEMALGAVEALLENGIVDDKTNQNRDIDGDGTVLLAPVVGIDATDGGLASMKKKQLYATVLQDVKLQAETAFELVLECAKNGTAKGYKTSKGLEGAKEVTKEPPVTKQSVLGQCYIVPFVPVTKAD